MRKVLRRVDSGNRRAAGLLKKIREFVFPNSRLPTGIAVENEELMCGLLPLVAERVDKNSARK